MNTKLIDGSAASDYLVTYPQTWRTESVAWAVRTALPQAEVDDIEARLAVFRCKRDNHRVGIFTVGVDERQVA